ncbi:hypothetical protein T01_5009, partial [Trichinella spiralis]
PIIGISDNRIDERKDSVNPSAYWIYQCRGKEFSALQKARLLTPPIRSVTTNYCIEAHAELRCYRHTFYMWLADSNPSPHDFWVGFYKFFFLKLISFPVLHCLIFIDMKYSAFRRHIGYLAFSHWTQSLN